MCLQVRGGDREFNVIGFPQFSKNSKVEEIRIKGLFIDPDMTNSITNVAHLKRITLDNIAVELSEDEVIRAPHFPKIIGLHKLFLSKDLEEVTLVNFKINSLPKSIKKAQKLKKLTIRRRDDYRFTDKDPNSSMLQQLPKELLELVNLEEIHLHVNDIEITLDLSVLPKLKKVTIEGGARLSKELKKKLEDKNVIIDI